MTLRELPRVDLVEQLKRPGLYLRTGPFVCCLQTTISDLGQLIQFLYADFPMEAPAEFADFHVRLAQPAGLRRWVRPQGLFFFDGRKLFEPFPVRLALPMLEWGLNWCVSRHAHQYLIIHSAVIERGGRAAILPAPAKSGKSTLCAALVHRGWRLLSDEFALLRPRDGCLVPLPRPISLKNASIALIRELAPDAAMGPPSADTRKGTIAHLRPPADSVARAGETARPAWLIFPSYQAGAPAELARVVKARAFLRVIQNSFNYSMLHATGFETVAAMIDACDCYDFTYGDLGGAIALFDSLGARAPREAPQI